MLIHRSLEHPSEDRTTVVIAHRLSTVRDADEILVLEGDRIVERGDHEDLLAKDGHSAKLWGVKPARYPNRPVGSSAGPKNVRQSTGRCRSWGIPKRATTTE